MTPREFLQANIDVIDPALLKEAGADLDRISTDKWYDKYKAVFMNNKDTAVDFYNIEQGKSLPERLRRAFGDAGFNPGEIWKQVVYQKDFKDVPREDFERNLTIMKGLYNEEKKLQEDEAARQRRIIEVKNPDWKRFLFASDYENQRYIDDPKSAIFGEQAPGFMGSSLGAKADLISGVAAGAADVGTAIIPNPVANIVANTLVGPGIRAGRDIMHKVTESPYQKDWTQIGKDTGTDVGLNLGAAGLANIGRVNRVASRLASPNVRSTMELKGEFDAIKEGLKTLPKVSNTDDFVHAIDKLPNSPLKTDLKTTVTDYANSGVDVNKARDIIKAYTRDTDIDYINLYKKAGPGGINKAEDNLLKAALTTPSTTPFLNKALTTAPLNTVADKAQYKLLSTIEEANKGRLGEVIFEAGPTVIGRGSTPKTVKTEIRELERNNTIDRIISNYSLLWNKKEPPAEFKKKGNEILLEAWEKWSKQ